MKPIKYGFQGSFPLKYYTNGAVSIKLVTEIVEIICKNAPSVRRDHMYIIRDSIREYQT